MTFPGSGTVTCTQTGKHELTLFSLSRGNGMLETIEIITKMYMKTVAYVIQNIMSFTSAKFSKTQIRLT